MSIKEQVRKGRRPRRENGNARDRAQWSVRGVNETTKLLVTILAKTLDTTAAGVIDLAVKRLFQEHQSEIPNSERNGHTISPKADLYGSLLEKHDTSSTDPELIKLEKRLQERRNARDELMGRKSTEAIPQAAEKLGG